ncbi:SGNH/GDSL hydrolase family protein [Corynebacterium uberis]|uniref:SGNH/GDSL hydrolase family protein n=1 Tax=Corynebacterium TaxID=1716 RepID=UPI001D0AA6FD|nr:MULTISPECIES: SGNH/GDSL hydrolase family protein [Corynebacterium]MCZ9309692.1 SGNH/GDSL hydrolase family protein [Corynebacterium sp. c6VSa_13]UDL73496.1 SGNH/GDSL hydrolase family protein [Corynebacterium uberis]UDL75624.1 SGNH/GDSL hydrolase family protein [Corynebacterium uberis]UDL77837.1 SGNH/GDSL hydrolase family protein [Corynebacterium uberis]UDL80120.1 SGNH/GDSL hydrolase family protein [Corynebacterium uberis]
MKKHTNALRAAVVATVAALGMGLGSAPATAAPIVPLPEFQNMPGMATNTPGGKELVTFGDSFSAHKGARPSDAGQVPWVTNCAADKLNWSHLVAQDLGKTLGDWTCNGTSVHLPLYLETAIKYGDLGPNTKEVVLMYGGLDPFQWADAAQEAQAAGSVQNVTIFRQYIKTIIDRIREVAPQARVTLTSYLEYMSNEQWCPVNAPGVSTPMTIPGANLVQEKWRDNLRNAAQANNAHFVDVYEASKGHGTCNPDPAQRWAVGLVDLQAPHTMVNHPTDAGQRGMANIITEGLR